MANDCQVQKKKIEKDGIDKKKKDENRNTRVNIILKCQDWMFNLAEILLYKN